MEITFSRRDTKIIKGIAIFLMLMHHLWAFPSRLVGGQQKYFFDIFGKASISYIGFFGKICVAMFMFIGGYGMYKSFENGKLDIIDKIKNLYITYWKVFIIFIPIAFIFFSNQPIYCELETICTRYNEFDWVVFWKNFFGYSADYNSEWWFFFSYLCVIVTFPLIAQIVKRLDLVKNIVVVLVVSLLVGTVFPALGNLNYKLVYSTFFCQKSPFFVCFCMGCVWARHDLIVRCRVALKNRNMINPVMDIIGLAIIVFFRSSVTGEEFDLFYVPFFVVFAIDFVSSTKVLKIIFEYLGKYSTNMWLIHAFFCYYFYGVAKIILLPKYAIVSLIIFVVLTFETAVLVDLFYKWLGIGAAKVKAFVEKLPLKNTVAEIAADENKEDEK